MADEIDITVPLAGSPTAELAAWRAQPPAFLGDAGFNLIDESYESLVYEANVTSRSMRILMFGTARTLYRVSVTFRSDPAGRTRVTINGNCPRRRATPAWPGRTGVAAPEPAPAHPPRRGSLTSG